MGHQHHPARGGPREVAEEVHHLNLERGVEARGGLVEEEQARPVQQLRAHPHPLALTAREVSDAGAPVGLEGQLGQHAVHGGAHVAGVDARETQAGGVRQGLVHREQRMHDLVLGHVAHVGQPGGHRLSVEGHAARAGTAHARQRAKQGGLARAALPDDGHQLARADRQRHGLEDVLAVATHGDARGLEAQSRPLVPGGEARSVEAQAVRADLDERPVLDHGATDRPAVELRAALGVEVAQLELAAARHHRRVEARDPGAPQHHVVAVGPPEGQLAALEGDDHLVLLSLPGHGE